MNQQELACNIQILEHLGWFVAEDGENTEFEVLLLCCRPDWSVLEEVPVNEFLLSLYEEEDGSLEERLWFFAPKYSTSLDNMQSLLNEDGCYEFSVSREYYLDTWVYDANVIALGFDDYDGEVYENSNESASSELSASMALAEAYLRCEGVWHETNHRG